MHTVATAAPARFAATNPFGRLLAAFAQKRLEWRTYSELTQLSDRALADLGVERGDLREVARRAAL